MKKRSSSLFLFLLAASLAVPFGSSSFAITPPVALNDSYSTSENNILDVSGHGVLSNDTSSNGRTLSAILFANVKDGALILNSNGSFIYVPDVNFHGIDGFRYVAQDNVSNSNIANVTITVNAVNIPPVAKNYSFIVNENATLTIGGNGILANDTDPDGDVLTASLVTAPLNGILMLNHNGSLTYTPNSNFHGMDSFTYVANDGTTNSNVATVSITVNQINSPPTNILTQILADIQNLFSRITGIEQEVSKLQQENSALETRVSQLENLVHSSTQNTNQTSTTNNGEHGDENENNGHHVKHVNQNKQNGNQSKQNDNKDD